MLIHRSAVPSILLSGFVGKKIAGALLIVMKQHRIKGRERLQSLCHHPLQGDMQSQGCLY